MKAVKCPACLQAWALVASQGLAHPGYRDGDQRWHPEGRTAFPRYTPPAPGATDGHYSWTCLCQATISIPVPATETVACRKCNRVKDMQDAAHWRQGNLTWACPCCGRQGTHRVRLDREGPAPACLT